MKLFDKWRPTYLRELLHKYQCVLLVCGLGLALMLWPGGEKAEKQTAPEASEASVDSTAGLEEQLEHILAQMEGVGRVQVLLTIKSGSESIYAYNKTESGSGEGASAALSRQAQLVTVSEDGNQIPVTRRQEGPVYQGAAVVCDGGGSPSVQLAVTRVVQSLTGISSDHIVISKMKQ